jgi:hypothetical protein
MLGGDAGAGVGRGLILIWGFKKSVGGTHGSRNRTTDGALSVLLKPILDSSLHHLGAVHASLRALQSERWHLRGQCPTAWHPSRARTLRVLRVESESPRAREGPYDVSPGPRCDTAAHCGVPPAAPAHSALSASSRGLMVQDCGRDISLPDSDLT